MSENENKPPTPSKQTSSVPLKKETVRVTLKAADAPPAVPSATVPSAPPVRPPTPTAPSRPTAGGPPKPTAAPAPTIPLRTAGAATAPGAAPAPTIRLATSTAPIGTAPLKPGGGGSPTLPKATVKIQAPTQGLGKTPSSTPSQAATLQMDDDDETEGNEGVINILAGVGLVAALAVLTFQLMLSSTWISVEDNPQTREWSQLIK